MYPFHQGGERGYEIGYLQAGQEAVLRITRPASTARSRSTLSPALGRQRHLNVGKGAAGSKGKQFLQTLILISLISYQGMDLGMYTGS